MTILDEIIEVKKEEVSGLRNKYSLNSFKEMKYFEVAPLSFINEIERNKNISIIAEVKKASPSKGIIKADFNHLKIAQNYFAAGVNAVSVLTDEKFFQGSINHLREIAGIKEVPILRKDFIIDEYQIFEAKANGADIVLLICEALSKGQVDELSHAAFECGLEVLLELHSADQVEKINFDVHNIIGVNNRNLKSFNVDLNTTAELACYLTDDTILVSESGITKEEDIKFLKKNGINAVLVGEHLMRSKNIKAKVEELKEWCSYES